MKKYQEIGFFLQDVKEELKNVTWVSKKQLFVSTCIILSSIFIFGMVIYLADLTIAKALALLHPQRG